MICPQNLFLFFHNIRTFVTKVVIKIDIFSYFGIAFLNVQINSYLIIVNNLLEYPVTKNDGGKAKIHRTFLLQIFTEAHPLL